MLYKSTICNLYIVPKYIIQIFLCIIHILHYVWFSGSSWKNKWGTRLHHYKRPSDVRPREERRPTVAELAQQKHALQKLNGWKVYHLTAQMEDIADLEKQVMLIYIHLYM